MSINIHINKQMPYYNYVNYKTSNLMMIYDYSIEGGWYEYTIKHNFYYYYGRSTNVIYFILNRSWFKSHLLRREQFFFLNFIFTRGQKLCVINHQFSHLRKKSVQWFLSVR